MKKWMHFLLLAMVLAFAVGAVADEAEPLRTTGGEAMASAEVVSSDQLYHSTIRRQLEFHHLH